jgi:hypothetical protein
MNDVAGSQVIPGVAPCLYLHDFVIGRYRGEAVSSPPRHSCFAGGLPPACEQTHDLT